MHRLKIFLFTSIIIISCNDIKPDTKKMANDFAGIECRAIALRQQRFALADQIRFTQDTLIKTHTNDTERLKIQLIQLKNNSQSLTSSSIVLADSIKHLLDSLMKHHLKRDDDKADFNKELDKALIILGCKG